MKEISKQHAIILCSLLFKIAEEKGITKYKIAKEIGISRTNVGKIEKGEFVPQLWIFIAICRVVGVNFFFEDKEGESDLNKLFEKTMSDLGRRPDNLPLN